MIYLNDENFIMCLINQVDVSGLNKYGSMLLRELDLPRLASMRYLTASSGPAATFRLDHNNFSIGDSWKVFDEEVHLVATSPGTVHAIAFWFHINLGTEIIDTLDDSNHYRQAACLVAESVTVSTGTALNVKLSVCVESGIIICRLLH